MDIFSPTIIDNAIITGSNNASLLQVSSPSATSAFFISGSGRVGIGTTSPLSTLTVEGGNININDGYSIGGNALGSYVPFLRYNNTGAGVPSSSFGHTTAYITSLGGGVFGTNDLIFYAGGLTQPEIMRVVGSTGFVGIGESSPSAKLEIRGSGATSATTALRVENSAAAARLTILDDGTSAFNTSHLYVSSSGRVGIGTTTPQKELDVNGSVRLGTIYKNGGGNNLSFLSDGSGAVTLNIGGAIIGTLYDSTPNFNEIRTSNNQNLSINARGSGSLFLQTTDTTRLTITGSNVGIGTTTPTNTLQVVGGITATSITASIISASSGITGSLLGTSSWAQSASNAINAQTASFLPVGTYQITSSWATNALTASFVNTASTNAFVQGGNSFGTTALLGTNDNQNLQFETNGSVRMTIISSSGDIGIGVATPQAELHISGANNDSLFRIQSPASASIMFVSGSGLVGIGTATPTQKISVDTGNVGFTSGFGISWDSDTEWVKRAAASDQLQFATQNTVRLNIGNTQGQLVTIGLGATTGTAQFQVRGGGATAASTAMRIEDSGGNARLTILDDGTSAFNTNHLYVSSSGNVGIGTATPVHNLVVNGNTGVSINANGATFPNIHRDSTDGGMLLRSWNGSTFTTNVKITPTTEVGIGTTSPTARLHVSGANADALFRVSSPSAASALFVSGSGYIGIGTGTPLLGVLDVNGAVRIRSSNQLYFGGTGAGDWQGAISGQASGLLVNANLVTINNGGYASPATQSFVINTSQNVAIGPHSPTARLHVSGASNAGLFKIDSPAVNNIIYVSGSGNVGIGTNLPTAELHISGASADSLLRVGSPTNSDIFFVNGNGRVGINTTSSAGFLGGNISTFTIFQNSGSGDGLTPSTGLQIINSGSSTSAQAQLSIVTVGDKFASFNIGTSGSGTQNNFWHLSKRNAANGHALNLYNNNNGTFSGPLFSFVSAGTSTLGEYTQIQINDITGRVGLQTTPSDFIHLYSEPGTNYLRIDATSVQAPPVNAALAKNGYGIIANDYFLAEPDYWMEIKLDANVVLIPCYLPA